MGDNFERDMSLTLFEVLEVVHKLDPDHLEIATNHEKTALFLMNHILGDEDVIKILCDLNENNYVKGPVPDDKQSPKRNKPVWIFKANWQGLIIYIKFKIFITKNKIYVISFHEDERI